MKKNSRQLGIGIVSNLVSVCVSLAISFLLTPFLINAIGKEAYSFFPISNNFATYMTIITSALNSMVSRFMTVAIAEGNKQRAKKYFSTVFFSNIIMSLILIIPMTLIIVFADKMLNVPFGLEHEVRLLFFFVFAAMIVSLISSVFSVATFARERLDLSALQSIVQNVLRALLLMGLFALLKPHIYYLGIVALCMATYNACVNVHYTRKLLPEYNIKTKYFDRDSMYILIKSGVWNSVNNLGSSLLLTFSLLMANTMVGVSAGGDMSIIQTLPNFMTTVISTIFTVLLSHITVVYSEGDKIKTRDAVIDGQKILGLISTVPAIIVLICGKPFYALWVPSENADYLQLLSSITIIPLILHSSMWTVYGLNIVNNKVKKPAIIFLMTGCVNLILTYTILLFTDFGLVIIPIVSTLCSVIYYLFFIPQYTAKQMELPWKTFYPHILKSFLLTVIMVVIFNPLISRMQVNNWFVFFLLCCVVGFVGLVMYMFIVLNVSDRIHMRRYILAILSKVGHHENKK